MGRGGPGGQGHLPLQPGNVGTELASGAGGWPGPAGGGGGGAAGLGLAGVPQVGSRAGADPPFERAQRLFKLQSSAGSAEPRAPTQICPGERVVATEPGGQQRGGPAPKALLACRPHPHCSKTSLPASTTRGLAHHHCPLRPVPGSQSAYISHLWPLPTGDPTPSKPLGPGLRAQATEGMGKGLWWEAQSLQPPRPRKACAEPT